jgi:hypothetical protein
MSETGGRFFSLNRSPIFLFFKEMFTSKSKYKIVVGTNSLANTTQIAYANHCQMWYLLGKRYTDCEFCFVNPPRMSIDRMRNLCATTALNLEATHVLFLDDDVLLPGPFDFLRKLLDCEADVAAADVLVRGYPFNHMIFQWIDKEKTLLRMETKVPKKRGPLPCAAVGFSVCLIDTKLIQKVDPPYFITGATNTEDVYFCLKAHEADPDIKVVCDTSIVCGHILGPEVIDDHNKLAYMKYHNVVYGKQDQVNDDRGESYLQRAKGVIHAKKTRRR